MKRDVIAGITLFSYATMSALPGYDVQNAFSDYNAKMPTMATMATMPGKKIYTNVLLLQSIFDNFLSLILSTYIANRKIITEIQAHTRHTVARTQHMAAHTQT